MRKIKKLLASAAALLFLFASGCSTKLPENTVPEAKGGYVGTNITPPDEMCFTTLWIFPHSDGSIDCLGLKDSLLGHIYSPDRGESWEPRETEWLLDVQEYCGIGMEDAQHGSPDILQVVDMDDNGNLYCVVKDHKALFRLLRISRDGALDEIPVPAWEEGGPEADYYQIKSLRVFEDGSLGVAYGGKNAPLVIYGGDGLNQSIYAATDEDWSGNIAAFSKAGIVALTYRDACFFDGKTGENLLRVPGQFLIAADHEGGLYLANDKGIDRLPPGGAILETILKGEEFSFVDVPDADSWFIQKLLDFACVESSSLYLKVIDKEEASEDGANAYHIALYRYDYDPELPLQIE